MIIWITGAAGFLGRRLVQRFRDAGKTVVPISRRLLEGDSISLDLTGSDAPSKLVSEKRELLTGDALIVAVMQANGLTHVASNDADFDRVPGLTRYAPA